MEQREHCPKISLPATKQLPPNKKESASINWAWRRQPDAPPGPTRPENEAWLVFQPNQLF